VKFRVASGNALMAFRSMTLPSEDVSLWTSVAESETVTDSATDRFAA
jgi:hypothetical protein